MGTPLLPVLLSLCAMLLAADFAATPSKAEAAPVVVGTVKCLDCAEKDVRSEDAFKGLHVAIKCNSSNGEYETKALGRLDGTGAFTIPLAAELLHEDGELKQNCLAQLHSAPGTPCTGLEPPNKIVPQPKDGGKNTFVAVAAAGMPYSSAACACGPFHKKHFMFHKPMDKPPKPDPENMPPQPGPEYKPPTPVPAPVYTPPTPPTPSYGPPAQPKPDPEPEPEPEPYFKKKKPFKKFPCKKKPKMFGPRYPPRDGPRYPPRDGRLFKKPLKNSKQ